MESVASVVLFGPLVASVMKMPLCEDKCGLGWATHFKIGTNIRYVWAILVCVHASVCLHVCYNDLNNVIHSLSLIYFTFTNMMGCN